MKERRIGSIPPRTTLDALREQEGKRGWTRLEKDFPGSSVSIGRLLPREPGKSSLEQSSEGFDVKRYVFKKPARERPRGSLVSPEIERITWQVEIHEAGNTQGDLVLILDFSGIQFTNPTFLESKNDYGPDSSVFYSPVGYKSGQAFLILGTFGDIFESQVVPKKKDVNPFFQEEIYWPSLLTLHDPKSMKPFYNNGLVVVSYAPLQSGELSKILA